MGVEALQEVNTLKVNIALESITCLSQLHRLHY